MDSPLEPRLFDILAALDNFSQNRKGVSNNYSMTEPNVCSITGVNFFGHLLDTNLFNENIRAIISENFTEWSYGK
ncbi:MULTISPECIES: hypothetical protein [Nitrosopumilus]|uniref:Uncharacterized protein n=1 Tax=Nitrosopumilus piranensis TaxID=1582439 RepID=A0A0C5BX79_9ARCH|nr:MULTISPECIES: hypothetical protein [Nitrosopumilus]AJM92921.1 hypothetical protein NPIRD3C_1709 [Nitrosopumilus piranensis]KAF6244713.1 hypothetical protein C6989_07555 [Nitrosopumilus sp. b2]